MVDDLAVVGQPALSAADGLIGVADILRRHGSDHQWAIRVAAALDRFVAGQGRLDELLGVAVRRGKSVDVLHRATAKSERDRALVKLAGTMEGALKVRAEQIAAQSRNGAPIIREIAEVTGAEVPSSGRQVLRILKSAAGR